MVVLMVTLYLRVSMRRPNGFSANLGLLKSGLAGALALAMIVACSDSTSPVQGPDGVIRVRVNSVGPEYSDAEKDAMDAAADLSASSFMSIGMSPISRNLMASASAALSSAGCGSGSEFTGYVKSRAVFAPEQIPVYAPFPVKEDGFMPDMPIGFSFSFYGKSYDRVNIYSNGLLVFGPAPSLTDGFPTAGILPSGLNPNNVIAFAWTDWSPGVVQDGIRYETRGAAPKRKYIVQFNDVPEFASGQALGSVKSTSGRVTVQVVLSEGSNDITVYTKSMSLTNSKHKYTQGIENGDGTDAKLDSILIPNNNLLVPRRAVFFPGINLTEDAVQFSLIPSAKDEQAPSIAAPADVSKGNDPGLASAVVAVGSPVASDNCSEAKVSSVRSDGAALDAPYPVGHTTITWTATDAAGNKASATQTVEVLDIEAPVFAPSAQSALRVNATSPAGAVVSFGVNVTDNVGVVSQSCEPASGSVFSAGNHEVTCSASDAAGNIGYKSFPVIVVSARQQMESLMDILRGLPNGTAQPLINQLRSAYSQQGNECKKMDDFMHLLSKKESNIESDMISITSAATDIIGALGCEVTASESAPAPSAPAPSAPAPRPANPSGKKVLNQ